MDEETAAIVDHGIAAAVRPLAPPAYDPPQDSLPGLLDRRAETHGDYALTAKVCEEIKDSAFWGPAGLTHEQRNAIANIAQRIARIVCGDPNHPDHWLDIEGYARLIRERLS
jgi:hypothetical protein